MAKSGYITATINGFIGGLCAVGCLFTAIFVAFVVVASRELAGGAEGEVGWSPVPTFEHWGASPRLAAILPLVVVGAVFFLGFAAAVWATVVARRRRRQFQA